MSAAAGATPVSHAVVVADGDVDVERLLLSVSGADLVIAADGAAAKALSAGVVPDIVIGDGDSLDPESRARLERLEVPIGAADPAKDESDTELCLLAAVDAGASRVTLLGALGGRRPEHSVANLLLLADPRFDGIDVSIVGHGSTLTRIGGTDEAGSLHIAGQPGDYVSLFALAGPVQGVRTEGLRFPLAGETLAVGPARGLSNELLDHMAEVQCERGWLLVIHTRRSIESEDSQGGS